jgi:small subunit ribosomal protein S6
MKLHEERSGANYMKYELLYIVPSRYTDAEVADVQKKVNGLIAQAGGAVTRETNLGKIRLAYPIKSQRHGTYVLAYFESEPSATKTLEAQLRLTDEVLRHMLLIAPKGAEAMSFELQSYVAPLSEEDTEERPRTRASRGEDYGAARAPVIAPPVAAPMKREEKPMSIEELDKKLDEILEEDLSEKA